MSFTAHDVASKALELATANPNHVYVGEPLGGGASACFYVRDGKGDCLFGQALVALGVEPSRLDRHVLTTISDLLVGTLGLPDGNYRDLEDVQFHQDSGRPWGDESIVGPLRLFLEGTA